jgi:hypothetical protein
MWGVQDHELVQQLGVAMRERPSYHPAPVVPRYAYTLRLPRRRPWPQVPDQTGDVVTELVQRIVLNALGLEAAVIASHIESDSTKPRRCQRRKLGPPCPPKVWEAVE